MSEVFGPTFQGEGPFTGYRARFVRLGGCNLSCGAGAAPMVCDTEYTWNSAKFDLAVECPETRTTAILEHAGRISAPITVLTGGEPMTHQRKPAFTELLTGLRDLGQVHVETNGTIPPAADAHDLVDHFTVSPKLTNTGDPAGKRLKPRALAAFAAEAPGKAVFKFVVATPDELTEVDRLVDEYSIPHPAVWIMPEGRTAARVLACHRSLADAILTRGYNTTTRLHMLLWPEEDRGR
nr:7-carboxy-7-deazaguanine synthase QueE [Kibdelosporangium phytohabitans]